MWMMGYNDGGDIQDSFNTRRLRNLMPRSAPIASSSTMNPSACLIHANDLLALNHQYLAMAAEQNKRESNPQQVVVSSRWNPTPEQLHTLEELYRRGTRTPSAEQIQHITAQLRRYGKIEGKNVFYWFQNHKARERQKRRRQLDEQQPPADDNNNINPKALTGANRTAHEVEQTNNWASSTNSSTVAPQKTVSTQEGTKVSDIAECKADGWLQFEDEAELLQRGKNATWRMMRLSCSSSTTPTTNRIINSSSSPPTITTSTATAANTIPSTNAPEDLNHSAQTLELFPLMSGTQHRSNDEYYCANDEDEAINMNSATISPYPYFEFLPLKN